MYIMRYSRTRSWSWQGCRGLTCQKCTIPDHTIAVSFSEQEDEDKGDYEGGRTIAQARPIQPRLTTVSTIFFHDAVYRPQFM